MLNKFKEKLELYGLYTTCFLVVKAIIKIVTHFSWQRIIIMSINPNDINNTLELHESINIRKLELADYCDKCWSNYIDQTKMNIYEKRFKDNKAHAYGVFFEGKLACSGWIYEGSLIISEKLKIQLASDEVLFFDDYCHQNYRRKGFHKILNNYRIYESKKLGANKCYVLVYSYNQPAIISQLHCGMKAERNFYVFRWNRFQYCTLKSL